MGNEDGFMSAIVNRGNNKVINGENYYFSFAYGNEIALYHGGSYFILNCDSELWDEVKKFMKSKPTFAKAKKWWKTKKKDNEVSSWSADF